MRRATHIRSKLGLALAVPLAAVLIMAGFEVAASIEAVDAAQSETALTTVAVRSAGLISALQDERNMAALDLVGLGEDARLSAGTSAQNRAVVDDAHKDLQTAVAGQSSLAARFASATDRLAALEALRADVTDALAAEAAPDSTAADGIFSRYSVMIDALASATGSLGGLVDDLTLRVGVDLVDAATQQTEVRARTAWVGAVAVITDRVSEPGVGQELAVLRDRASVLNAEIVSLSTGPFSDLADLPQSGGFDEAVEELLAGRPVGATTLFDGLGGGDGAGDRELRIQATAALTAAAAGATSDAMARQWTFGGLALAMFLLAPLLTWLAVRSITRPLASLRQQAQEMAETTLPAAVRQILDTPFGDDVVIPKLEPIQVTSNDEVAGVAKALSAVQTSALDLAVEQAVLRRNISDSYINLGRRNQNLLGRQLDFITELERNEADPDTLEGLFRLDHLATRMRRNAESLLVLAGVEAPRQWAAPVRVSDVVRAALGEVEDYQRVVIRHLEPASLTGAVAADIAHITAELIENALSFSAPEQQVEVKGRLTLGGYIIAISDNGFGMPADDLARANRRLAGAESFTVAPSRYLGHYVAGHLASRLGVGVELQDSPAGGITARVDVPMGLVADDETDPRLNKELGETARLEQVAAEIAEPASVVVAPTPEELAESLVVEPTAEAAVAPASFTTNGLQRRGDRRPEPEPEPEVEVEPQVEAAPQVIVEPPIESAPAADPVTTRGFGGLAATRPTGPSLFTVTARNARNGGVTPPAESGNGTTTTHTGLTRRVPGAQRPDMPVGAARPADEPRAGTATTESSPEDMYSFLSRFQSGVERGRVEGQSEQLGDDCGAKSMEDFG